MKTTYDGSQKKGKIIIVNGYKVALPSYNCTLLLEFGTRSIEIKKTQRTYLCVLTINENRVDSEVTTNSKNVASFIRLHTGLPVWDSPKHWKQEKGTLKNAKANQVVWGQKEYREPFEKAIVTKIVKGHHLRSANRYEIIFKDGQKRLLPNNALYNHNPGKINV